MVTAAGVAHANRLPVLLLAGDTFTSRVPDPVLQQVEHFGDPTITVNDAFKPVTRYWDRITRPEQLMHVAAARGGHDARPGRRAGRRSSACPRTSRRRRSTTRVRFFEPIVHAIARPRADDGRARPGCRRAAQRAERPLIIAGGGVHYSVAEAELRAFAEQYTHPGRRDDGRQGLRCSPTHPLNAGPIGVTGCESANDSGRRGRRRRSRSAPGSRTSRPARGPSSPSAGLASSGSTPPRFDATQARRRSPVVGDARETLADLSPQARRLDRPRRHGRTDARGARPRGYHAYIDKIAAPRRADAACRPTPRSSAPSTASRCPTTTPSPPPAASPASSTTAGGPKGARQLRLRVRLLVHGLRDLRRLGRQDGDARPRGRRVRRRRLVPDDELRPLLVGALRATS